MACDHKRIVLTLNGWYCPDCGQTFKEKPAKSAEKPDKKNKEDK